MRPKGSGTHHPLHTHIPNSSFPATRGRSSGCAGRRATAPFSLSPPFLSSLHKVQIQNQAKVPRSSLHFEARSWRSQQQPAAAGRSEILRTARAGRWRARGEGPDARAGYGYDLPAARPAIRTCSPRTHGGKFHPDPRPKVLSGPRRPSVHRSPLLDPKLRDK